MAWRPASKLRWATALLLLSGCVRAVVDLPPEALARRIVPEDPGALAESEGGDETGGAGADRSTRARAGRPAEAGAAKPADPPGLEAATGTARGPRDAPAPALTMEDGEALALRLNPQLEQSRAAVDTAAGNEQVAYSAFLPSLTGNYSFQDFSSAVGFAGTPHGGRFPVLPVRGFGPGAQDFSVTELQLRWTVFQFGKQVARHDQSVLREDIAKLQLERSCQSVKFEVRQAYFRLLEARASLVSAEQAVVRAEAALRDARDLEQRGVITHEDVLRAEVQVAEVRQLRTSARSVAQVAVAALNRAIGQDVNAPTEVAERRGEPPVTLSLADALRLAVANRREFAVVQKGVAVAAADVAAAKADFLPAFSIQSSVADVTGTNVQNARVAAGGIFVTLDVYTGGRRRGQLNTANAGVRRAVAQAQQVCDGIAYEVHVAYRGIEDARERIGQARTADAQARENLRLIRNRYETGDVTLTDLIDAETTMTRAAQNFSAAYYDYQTAVARLEFAVGAPVTSPGAAPEAAAAPEGPPPPPPSGVPSPFARPAPEPSPRTQPSPLRMPSLLPQPPSPPGGPAPTGPSVTLPPEAPSPTAPGAPEVPGLARPPYEQQTPTAPAPSPGSLP